MNPAQGVAASGRERPWVTAFKAERPFPAALRGPVAPGLVLIATLRGGDKLTFYGSHVPLTPFDFKAKELLLRSPREPKIQIALEL